MKKNESYLEALVGRDHQKITEIYDQYYDNVKKYIISNGGQEADAEDVFQRVLLQIAVRYRKEKFEIKSDFEGYLFIACRNSWIREAKKSKRMLTTELKEDLKDEYAVDLSMGLLEQKRWELFNDGLSLLSDKCRQILNLYFAKVPYDQIMDTLKYSSETVARQRVFKCKAKLKEIITKNKYYNSLKEL
ncbi:MAG: sigma-70 family RNA polymerase sigma factor [Bacteroidota bacterium]